MSHDERPASLVIFDELKHAAIRGWQELKIAGHQAIARVNPHVGYLELWVLVTEPDGKGGEKLCYEQPKIFENLCVIVLIEDEAGRICFVQNFRQVGERLPGVPLTRTIEILSQNPSLWPEVFARLGQWQWELPKGTVTSKTAEYDHLSDREVMFEIARHEAREEAGCELEAFEFVGWLHMHDTTLPYPGAVIRAKLAKRVDQTPEEHEFLGAVQFFTPGEIRERINEGSLGCATILGALLMAGIQIPPSPRR